VSHVTNIELAALGSLTTRRNFSIRVERRTGRRLIVRVKGQVHPGETQVL